MKFSTDQIVKLLQVKGLGRSRIFKFIELIEFRPGSDIELAEALLASALKIKLPQTSLDEILKSFEKAEQIIFKSDQHNISIISFYDPKYPKLLKNIKDSPILISLKGKVSDFDDKPSVAVIGTRDPSTYGKQIAERIGFRLGEEGVNVVSGLALGCDTAAHVGCLRANGVTTAVLAHGLDMNVYPKENARLAEKILEQNGYLVSEYLVGTRGMPNFFIERDRIQAGLSLATIVVETDIKGGTMHTVNYTTDYDRLLAVFNHPVEKQNDKSKGNQFLLESKKGDPLQTKEDIDLLLDKVHPGRRTKHHSNEGKDIADIQLPLFNEQEYELLKIPELIPKEKTKRKKRSKPNSIQNKFFPDDNHL